VEYLWDFQGQETDEQIARYRWIFIYLL